MNQETINKIVKASGVTAGEMILIHFWGEDTDKEIANRFMTAVSACGASPVLLQQARSVNQNIFASAKERTFDERYFAQFDAVDAVLDIFAYQPIILGATLPEKQQALYRRYIATLFGKFMQKKRFAQIRIPTTANAKESGLEAQDYICRMNAAYDIDYDALQKVCETAVSQFDGIEALTLYTGESEKLHLTFTGRCWHIDAGDGDLPCGEIYIAPVEEKTNGSVWFKELWLEDISYGPVILHIQNGVVIGSDNEAITAYFAGLPENERAICELGFGMNPNVPSLCGYTVLDEKMHGTFHVAIGANTMFGGMNEARGHIDFVGTGKVL